jgi:hypothetical protein
VTAQKIANAITNLPAGWTVDPNGTTLKNGELVVTLKNPSYLAANVTSFGNINFNVALPGSDTTTAVTLKSLDLFTDDGQGNLIPVETGCVTANVNSTDFTLVYLCGDSTLQMMMNGNRSFLQVTRPASPSPASNNLTVHYLTSIAQPVSLVIYDALGNEVDRVMDRVDQVPGVYDVSCDVSGLSSGTYTYRLSGRDVATSKQFIVKH